MRAAVFTIFLIQEKYTIHWGTYYETPRKKRVLPLTAVSQVYINETITVPEILTRKVTPILNSRKIFRTLLQYTHLGGFYFLHSFFPV